MVEDERVAGQLFEKDVRAVTPGREGDGIVAESGEVEAPEGDERVVWCDDSDDGTGAERPQFHGGGVRTRREKPDVGLVSGDGSDDVGAVVVGDRQRPFRGFEGVDHRG
jgi:hypothetical protein